MEKFGIQLNDAQSFDAVLKGSLPDGGDVTLITKDNATTGGNPAVMLTFSVQLPDGSMAIAQTVTTLRNFLAAAQVLKSKYGAL